MLETPQYYNNLPPVGEVALPLWQYKNGIRHCKLWN